MTGKIKSNKESLSFKTGCIKKRIPAAVKTVDSEKRPAFAISVKLAFEFESG